MTEIEAIKIMLQAYTEASTPVTQEFYQGLCLKAIEAITKLQADLDEHRWIPVEEQLPEKTKDDLRPQILVFDGESVTGALWRHYDCGWDFETDRGKPTHWRLIILPKGEQNGS